MIFRSEFRGFLYAAVSLSLFFLGCTGDRGSYRSHVIVKVNEESMTAEAFSERLATRLKTFNELTAKDSAVVAQAKSSIIQEFIVQVVTRQWAREQQIFVRKEEIDAEAQKIIRQYPDEIAFRKSLADEGIPYDRWEASLTDTLLERRVSEVLSKSLPQPTEEEVKKYYQANKSSFNQPAAVKIRQIILPDEAAAQKVKKELQTGKSIQALAKKLSLSIDASMGGDSGWIEKGVLDIFDSAFKMNVGQQSGVLKSPYGYHIFELLEKRAQKNQSLDEARKRIVSVLLARSQQDIYQSWLESQVLRAKVFIDEEFLKNIKVHSRSSK